MDLRAHDNDPKLTVATYQNQEEATKVATAVAPFHKRILTNLGFVEGIDIHKDPSLTVLDDGQMEMTHRTARLAKFAGKLAKSTATRLNYRPSEVSGYTKEQQALEDTISQYLSDRVMSLPTYEEEPKPDPTPNEVARKEAFEKIKQPHERILSAGIISVLGGAVVGIAGRFTEAFAVNPNIPDHVNETVRQVGNDMSYAGVAAAVLGIISTVAVGSGRMRNQQGFEAGWNEATNRLDPDGLLEARFERPEDVVSIEVPYDHSLETE